MMKWTKLLGLTACAAWLGATGCADDMTGTGELGEEASAQRFASSAESLDDDARERCGGPANVRCSDRDDVCIFPPGTCDVVDNVGTCQERPGGCPRVWDPVCGCDGETYGNACEATNAGASIDHRGECRDEARCADNGDCGRGDYCAKRSCDAPRGTCEERPRYCTMEYRPVCGCDGETYSNRCHAASAGVNVAHEGECRVDTCEENSDCAARNFYCAKERGCEGRGECTERPEACPKVLRPVCGCDGKTYDNRCYAARAGVNVEHEGACVTQCEHTEQCPDPRTQFCQKRQCGGVGACADRPEACPRVWDPVCACNGETYGNACEANADGWNVRHEGPCFCGGIQGIPCDEGEFCDPDPGMCHVADATGECVVVGEYCPAVYDPVCGCDGRTYGNDCERVQAGVAKAHDGACRQPTCCDPTDEPGTHGNPFCIEGATCCDDGEWRCNAGDGSSTCGGPSLSAAESAAEDEARAGEGRVCEACCNPREEPGAHGNPHCFEGATCCGDGTWACNAHDGSSTCRVDGHVCDRDDCSPIMCTLYCEYGFKTGPDGCPICECNERPRDARE